MLIPYFQLSCIILCQFLLQKEANVFLENLTLIQISSIPVLKFVLRLPAA